MSFILTILGSNENIEGIKIKDVYLPREEALSVLSRVLINFSPKKDIVELILQEKDQKLQTNPEIKKLEADKSITNIEISSSLVSSYEDCENLIEILNSRDNIKTVNINNLCISAGQMVKILDALQKQNNLEKLDFNVQFSNTEVMDQFVSIVDNMKSLKKISLSGQCVNVEDKKQVLKALEKNENIKEAVFELYWYNNPPFICNLLCGLLINNKTLTTLELFGSMNFNPTMKEKIIAALNQNTTITSVTLSCNINFSQAICDQVTERNKQLASKKLSDTEPTPLLNNAVIQDNKTEVIPIPS